MEVLGEPAGTPGEDREPGVVSHGPQRVLTPCHVGDDQPSLLDRVSEHPAQGGRIEAVVGQRVERRLDAEGLGVHPVPVGSRRRQLGLHPRRVLHLAALPIEEDHVAGAELAGGDRPGLLLGANTRLRGDEDDFRRHRPPGGSEPVAVHAGEQRGPVGGGDGGRSVPGLGEERVVGIERGQVGIEVGHVLPRRRHQHLLDMGQGTAALQQELEDIVEAPRVGDAGLEEREDVGQPVAPHPRRGAPLPGSHPGAVGLDGVDLTVVPQGAERLRVVPGGEGVRRVPLVEDGERRLVVGVPEVPIEVRDVGGGEQALVDDGPARRRRDGETGHVGALDLLASQVEETLELGRIVVPGHDGLLDQGEDPGGVITEDRGVDRHRPPEEDLQTLGLEGLGDHRPGCCRLGR